MACAVKQESVVVLLADVKALKNPVAQTSHLAGVVLEPIVFVNLPGGHLGWAMHLSIDNNVAIGEM